MMKNAMILSASAFAFANLVILWAQLQIKNEWYWTKH
jgi:hypothetical protein